MAAVTKHCFKCDQRYLTVSQNCGGCGSKFDLTTCVKPGEESVQYVVRTASGRDFDGPGFMDIKYKMSRYAIVKELRKAVAEYNGIPPDSCLLYVGFRTLIDDSVPLYPEIDLPGGVINMDKSCDD